eukprot:gnl/MRDRNA2_/MRDRNA2_67888_c0_seq1.p1 gnl/MRDRNA2_/MRDRNA2_67888_c0~~gnl/MRDRNA2_/MRDRNA2_67888_c0_seq1.p1  ORF type:complete len:582 (+),score=102.64 gnl/MRDRNA2_/MRDRNA2_67888_c0_seq1:144-1889(+)
MASGHVAAAAVGCIQGKKHNDVFVGTKQGNMVVDAPPMLDPAVPERTTSQESAGSESQFSDKKIHSKKSYLESTLKSLIGIRKSNSLTEKKESAVHRLVYSAAFSFAITFVIIANAVQIGLETDDRGKTDWFAIEVIFLLIYMIEILLRLLSDGISCFKDAWFLFDLVIVAISSLDLVAKGIMPSGGSVVVLRIARLGKLVRILRLFRFCDELYLLVSSLTQALRTVAWMWVLLGLVIYMFSVLFTNELGSQYPDDDEVQEWWGTILRSSFTLFTIITLEDWVRVARHIWLSSPFMVFLMIVFITLTAYAIINVVIAVIVQNVVEKALSSQDDNLKQVEKELEQSTRALLEIFVSADVDSDWTLTKPEFIRAVTSVNIKQILTRMDVDFTDMSPAILFDQIDINEDGQITIDEFVQGVMQMRGLARAKRLFEVNGKMIKQARLANQRFDQLEEKLQEGLSSLHLQLDKKLDDNMSGVHQVLKRQEDSLCTLTEAVQNLTKSMVHSSSQEEEEQSGAHDSKSPRAPPGKDPKPVRHSAGLVLTNGDAGTLRSGQHDSSSAFTVQPLCAPLTKMSRETNAPSQ